MKNNTKWAFALCFFLFTLYTDTAAAPTQTTHHIKIDQFGYFKNARKVAVIADPKVGNNASESFNPGTGTSQYQVVRWADDVVVFSGTLQAWNNGNTHTQSGDRGWWFDFSTVTTPGAYYIYDAANKVGSYKFEIGEQVYSQVLKQAMRTFYYQRINFAKQAPYTDARWAEGAWFEGANQDRFATSRYAKGDAATARDVHGGWMDAGDLNKYTTFAGSAVIQLMEAYRINPSVFTDDYNIPESGNGIPDILDEVKWELDFLKRMQDATGTNGFLLKVGVDNYNEVSPPSTDTRPRYYVPECTSATIFGCSMFAVSGVTLKSVPALSAYGQDLVNRAELAWLRAKETTSDFTVWQTACDDGDIKSGDADRSAEQQLDNIFVAAVYLYEATGKSEYKHFAEVNYTKVNPYKISWWGPYYMPQQLALLRLTTLPGISTTVVNNIRNQKAGMENLYSIPTYTAATDLYRAHLNDEAYHWGHNQARADAGTLNLNYITFDINPTKHAQYKEVAEQYIHWMHGANPMGMVFLSNMYQYGAEKCVNEVFHRWFKDGSKWDNAITSTNGPAPGYVPGGPNKRYSGPIAGIADQPHQKAYKDWNTDWPENSWEIAEPAIYYQAAYIMLLARLMPATGSTSPADTIPPTIPADLRVEYITDNSTHLSWTASSDNVAVAGYDVYHNDSLVIAGTNNTAVTITGLNCTTTYNFTVKAKDAAGNFSGASNVAPATTSNCNTYTTSIIYDDVLGGEWQYVATGVTTNFNNIKPVKEGTRSIKADFATNGALQFSKLTAATTGANTEVRFWVYNNSKNDLKVFIESATGIKSTAIIIKAARSKWVEVIIGMNQLGKPSTIQKVVIQNATTGTATMYFDQVRVIAITEKSASASLSRIQAPTRVEAFSATWKFYPNPAREYVIAGTYAQSSFNIPVYLFDNAGSIVRIQSLAVHKGYNQHKIDIAHLSHGTYYLQLMTEDGIISEKIIIQ